MIRRCRLLPLLAAGLLGLAAPAGAGLAPGTLLIYYGWPSGINGTFAVAAAAAELARYDHVVLGDGLFDRLVQPGGLSRFVLLPQVPEIAAAAAGAQCDQ